MQVRDHYVADQEVYNRFGAREERGGGHMRGYPSRRRERRGHGVGRRRRSYTDDEYSEDDLELEYSGSRPPSQERSRTGRPSARELRLGEGRRGHGQEHRQERDREGPRRGEGRGEHAQERRREKQRIGEGRGEHGHGQQSDYDYHGGYYASRDDEDTVQPSRRPSPSRSYSRH